MIWAACSFNYEAQSIDVTLTTWRYIHRGGSYFSVIYKAYAPNIILIQATSKGLKFALSWGRPLFACGNLQLQVW